MSQSGMSAGDFPQEAPDRFYHDAFEFHIDVERRLVRVRFGETVSGEEIAAYVKALRSHPDFRPTFAEIVDLREVTEFDLQAEDFLRLADHIDPFSNEAKRAFVARSSVQKHAARMHKILRAQRNIALFNSIEEAEHWIRCE